MQNFTNSIQLSLVPIQAGTFQMGEHDNDEQEWDERPLHEVTLSQSFLMSNTPITNRQYEEFDPTHRKFRGIKGLSNDDDEAVICVTWHDAVRFCEWLSKKEGKNYRLPTEAEWEYACRAGTTTPYWYGSEFNDEEDRMQMESTDWDDAQIAEKKALFQGMLKVAQYSPNHWGLYDMHGLVEEWCLDWYQLYTEAAQMDPRGPESGDFKVTRGGSHHTDPHHLRSASRFAALPEDSHWLIGFRVVLAPPPTSSFSSSNPLPLCQQNISQNVYPYPKITPNLNPNHPYWRPPISYVNFPTSDLSGPFYSHNHCPSITWCANGDLLAIWFSTMLESGREMVILGSRLRQGADAWDPASVFFKCPGRNMTGSALFNDGNGTILHFNGIDVSSSWANLVLALRISTDNGATWNHPRLINPNHQYRNQVISGTLRTHDGMLIQCCDAVPGAAGGTAVHLSRDGGQTWVDPGYNRPTPTFQKGESGAWIAGIHGHMVELKDGRWLALGRGNDIDGMMPMSISSDQGQNWTYYPSPFPPITGAQRLVLMRLQEGPLFLATFTEPYRNYKRNAGLGEPPGLHFLKNDGTAYRGWGLFVALSYDEGETWPVRKLLTDGEIREVNKHLTPWRCVTDATHAEPLGYFAATQSPDGLIHLISSGTYYCFNLKWIETRPSFS
jgi:formylglycine-generating enzyme required for sulfatase activity